MTVLVVGATGMLGRPVAQRLIEEGHAVRVLARNPTRARAELGERFDYVAGDVGDPDSLARALDRCRAVHVNLRGRTLDEIEHVEVDGVRAIADAARRVGVERLTYLSAAGIELADPSLLPVRVKRAAEAAIIESGVPFTILRATHFMESLDLFVRGRSATILGYQPQRFHYIAAADFARQAVRALGEPRAANMALTLLGPEPMTMREALEVYVRIARPDLKITQAPLGVLRVVAAVTRNPQLRLATALFGAFQRIGEGVDDGQARMLLGPATTRLDQWCAARVAVQA